MKEHLIFAAKVLGVTIAAEAVGLTPWIRAQVASLTAPKTPAGQ